MFADLVRIAAALHPPGWPLTLADLLSAYKAFKANRADFKAMADDLAADPALAADLKAFAAHFPSPT